MANGHGHDDDDDNGVQTSHEISTSTQVSRGGGTVKKLIIHVPGSSGVWRVWDSIGTTTTTGNIVWAAQASNPLAAEGAILDLDWPLSTGLYLEVPTGGVCAVSWTESDDD
jgi:hypothetical protein